jgi:beta-N-acetylhexosaminidase
MVGVSSASEATSVVEEHHIGGVFVGGNDTALLKSGVLDELRGPGGVAPFVAVDEEGGRVQRIDAIAGSIPSARVMSQTMSPAQVTELARARGAVMAELGVNVDFAPVVDISDQPAGDVIGDRSFSLDPEAVIRYAGAFALGLQQSGILPVIKHFPGHGRASGDSHEGITTTPAIDTMDADLRPYRELLGRPPVGVMIGHLDVPGLTEGVPASLAPQAIDGLLRSELGFGGVVFTDELGGMLAVAGRYSLHERIRRALAAGADVALLASSGQAEAILDQLEEEVSSGGLAAEAVDRSVVRVLVAKGFDPCSAG